MSNSLWPQGLYSPWNSPGQNTGVGSLSLLQGSSQPRSPHCRWILYQLSHQRSPRILEWVAYPFSRASSWPRNWTRVSCTTGGFFTNWAIREGIKYTSILKRSHDFFKMMEWHISEILSMLWSKPRLAKTMYLCTILVPYSRPTIIIFYSNLILSIVYLLFYLYSLNLFFSKWSLISTWKTEEEAYSFGISFFSFMYIK